jgi:hypothetical protein
LAEIANELPVQTSTRNWGGILGGGCGGVYTKWRKVILEPNRTLACGKIGAVQEVVRAVVTEREERVASERG